MQRVKDTFSVRRPFLWVTLFFMAGLYAAGMGWCPGWAMPLALVLLATLLTTFAQSLPYRNRVSAAMLFFAVGVLVWNAHHVGPPGDSLSRYSLAHPETEYILEGWVVQGSIPLPSDKYARFTLDVDRAQVGNVPLELSGRVLVRWYGPSLPVHTAERLRVRGTLNHAIGRVNHGVKGIEDYYHSLRVFSQMDAAENAVEKIGVCGWSPYYWASRIRNWEAGVFLRALPGPAAPLIWTVWLGESGQIHGEEYDAYIRSGTAHILSVSGVHVGIVFFTLDFVLSMLVRSRRTRSGILIAALLLFALTARASVACLRSAIMFTFFLAANLVEREPDAPTALSLSGFLLLLVNPNNLFDTGFLLSFTSVASILIFAKRLSSLMAWVPGGLRGNIAITIGAQLLTAPLAIHYFHAFPVIGVLANLIVVPLLTAVLWLCCLTVVSAVALPASSVLFGHAIHPLAVFIQKSVFIAAAAPGGHFALVSPTRPAVLLYWAAAGALAYALAAKPRWKASLTASGLLFVAACICWRPWSLPATVDFLDVGHGDATFVHTPGGTNVLIDGGDRTPYADAGARTVAPFLYGNGVNHLDFVFVTHPEHDHIGGLFYILRDMPVGAAVLGPPTDHPLERDFLDLCKARGVPVIRAREGSRIPVAGAELEVLHPPAQWQAEKLNEASLVLRLTWPGISVLLTGDIEHEAETLLAQQDCRAIILEVPHHGSHTSSSSAFLDAVSPTYAVISVEATGFRNTWRKEVLKRYALRGITVLRTDFLGGIRAREENGVLTLLGARPARGYTLEPPTNVE